MIANQSIYEAFPDLESRWSAFTEWEARTEQFYTGQLVGNVASVLEPGCGYGRMLLPLAKAGIAVCGFDSIPERIGLARKKFAAERLTNAEFLPGKMPAIPTDRTFDAVILTVNAIGYLLSPDAKSQLLRGIHDALNPGGRLLFDFQLGEQTLRWLRSMTSLCGNLGPDQLHSRIRWDDDESCIVEEFTLRRGQAGEKTFKDRFRFGTIGETEQLLAGAGLKVTNRWGGFDASPLQFWSQTAILEARRPLE